MKRTIKEVYDLIKKKRDSASIHITILAEHDNYLAMNQVYGSMLAYEDVLFLIESSHLLEEDKLVKGSESETPEARCYRLEVEYQKLERGYSNLKKEYFKIKKALEIIETKKVDIKAIIESDYIWQYNSQLEYHPKEDELTQEEYDLLKEEL